MEAQRSDSSLAWRNDDADDDDDDDDDEEMCILQYMYAAATEHTHPQMTCGCCGEPRRPASEETSMTSGMGLISDADYRGETGTGKCKALHVL